jgi:hypothetical protein
MSTDVIAEALDRVAALRAGERTGAWSIDRVVVADRLAELVTHPDRVRQGRLNLCGPAALWHTWLRRDPVAAVTYAAELYEAGHARIGPFPVRPSRGLMRHPYGLTDRARTCPPADWVAMAALRDSTNRLLPYSRPGGLTEAPAAITMPGALRRWLLATGAYAEVRDDTNLVLRRGLGHAAGLRAEPPGDVFLLVAQEMFFRPVTWPRRARARVVGLLPNHWVLLRSAVRVDGAVVRFDFWSWGTVQAAAVDRSAFDRCYFGALVARSQPGPEPGAARRA